MMKRRLPAPAAAVGSWPPYPDLGRETPAVGPPIVTDSSRFGQVRPLGEDPSLTPRSLANSVAELEALRSRVHELELKLSQQDVELLPMASSKSTKKLPPLEVSAACEQSPVAIRGATDTKSPFALWETHPGIERIATAPDVLCRKATSSPIPQPPASSCDSNAPIDLEHPSTHLTGDSHERFGSAKASTSSGVTADSSGPPSPASSVISTSSPNREQAKISLEQDGDTTFALSQRNRLYQILKIISGIITIGEDDLVLLKKLVDAEIGDVIKLLLSLENEDDPSILDTKLQHFLQTGSPAKHRVRRHLEITRQHPLWGIQYPLQKIARNLEDLHGSPSTSLTPSSSAKTDVIVLVASGAYNPIHMLHIRAFYVARQYVESNYKFPVVGAFISPSHDTYVRAKNRRNPREMITKRHRLGLIEAAVASSSWIEVDKWEITRRRVLDYLSTLTHMREMCESHFPLFKFHVMYVCGCNTVVKLSHSALRDEGFGCITVCRPTQTEMVMKHLGKTLAKTTTIVEDTGVLPCDLERATSFRVRQMMLSRQWESNLVTLEMMVGKPALQYLAKHSIPHKVSGREPWSDEDKSWRDADQAYVEYIES